MSQTSHANTSHHLSDNSANGDRTHVYPIESFVKIQALMRKLNLSPADCLQILAEVLEDLDSQIEDFEESGDGLPFPPFEDRPQPKAETPG